ncbi:hypothetical protein P691DRAFT_183335 [Macrolepiota fuliginosa MF-IS2]|uniref:Gfd2/YDR514C-like C-terminal domain-containing protein n=1 Tax=Macrolepiota fuliginosa MF-IS2 TaxID=1400762 RepID=A0A9P5XAW9_9AGAR|nr:hypothetical protein P691DRAFT_183335 [Macrolepiota fuliginosa MF-IS2]
MTDFTLVDPKGWKYDLHSVYSAYIGYFQVHNIPWFERTWGHLFTSFEDFLAFSWPVITVTDAYTGRAHIVTRLNSIGAFLKMIKTRFGETLPQAPNILQVTPFETTTRHLRNISDYATYRKLYSTLPAAVLAAQRTRVRAGEPKAIKELWAKREKTFLALGFVWSERNEKSCLEFGYAAVRCGHMDASGHWPPIPDTNYRKGHYVVEEYADKVINKHPPNQPWQFGETQLAPKAKLPQIIQAVISSLSSPDSDTSSSTIVLIGHGTHTQLARLEEMKIKVPHNALMIDIANFEKSLYATGDRGVMPDPKNEGLSRAPGSTLSLENLLRSFQHTHQPLTSNKNSSSNGSRSSRTPSTPPHPHTHPHPGTQQQLPQCTLANAGNEAFMSLFALQMLLDPTGTRVPSIKKGKLGNQGQRMHVLSAANMNTMNVMNNGMNVPMGMGIGMPGFPMGGMGMPGMPMPGLSPMPMPMYGMPGMSPMMPGVPGLPMAAANGGTVPSSPYLGPANAISKTANDIGNGDMGERGRPLRSPSVYNLGSEFGQMQLSMMTRAQSSGPTLSANAPQSGGGGGIPGYYANRKDVASGIGKRASILDMEKTRRRSSSYGALLR